MKPELTKEIDPQGIYTGAQAIRATGIPMTTFYRYVREEKIPKHQRYIDGKTVFLGHELLKVLTRTKMIFTDAFFSPPPKRGRPKKKANP